MAGGTKYLDWGTGAKPVRFERGGGGPQGTFMTMRSVMRLPHVRKNGSFLRPMEPRQLMKHYRFRLLMSLYSLRLDEHHGVRQKGGVGQSRVSPSL